MGVLSKLTIAVTGTLPYEPIQIKRWVEVNGGKWSARVKEGVTHLIASKEEWKKATDPVQQASAIGIWVVSYDWFEDSLQSKRKLSEKKYTLESLGKERRKRKELKRLGAKVDGTSRTAAVTRKPKKSTSVFFTASSVPATPFVSASEDLKRRRAERKATSAGYTGASGGHAQAPIEIEDDCASPVEPFSSSSISTPVTPARSASRKAESPPSSSKTTASSAAKTQAKTAHFKDLYHYYLDTTGFEYKIVLARSDFSTSSFARYHIGLLESHTKPQTYCAIVQYTPPAKPPPGTGSGVPASPGSGLRNPLLSFLRKGNNAVAQQQPANKNGVGTVTGQTSTHHPESSRRQDYISHTDSSPAISSSQQGSHLAPDQDVQHSEAARLQSLITKPAPISATPYKALICSMNSDFASAWRAFRHAFRDLTLLTWEERFDADRAIQKARAKQLNIEPFLYSKPAKGLPMGLLPQEAGLLQGSTNGLQVRGESEAGYVRNAFNLPSISHPLSKNGAIGSAIRREEEEQRKKEEQKRLEAEEKEQRKRRKHGEVMAKKPNYNKPMFNCATGRPQTDAYGQYTRNAPVGAGFAGVIKRSKPFMSERYE